MKIIQKTFSYRLKTTSIVSQVFAQYAGNARFVYNYGLALIKKALEEKSRLPRYSELAHLLPRLKQEEATAWLSHTHSQVLQQSLKDLDNSIQQFLRGVKKKAKVKRGFPHFKKKGIQDSFRYPQGIRCHESKIFLPKIGWVKYIDTRPLEGQIKQATIKREHQHWFIHIVCTIAQEIKLVPFSEDNAIGIDVGLLSFAHISNGQTIANPRFLSHELKHLRSLQKAYARTQKGSNNRKKLVERITRVHSKIKNKRKDFLHKVSTALVKSHDIVAVENLNVKGMLSNRHLARSIADVGWSMFIRFLQYKCYWYGKHFVMVDRFLPSSKACSRCGTLQDMPLAMRIYQCRACGLEINRDFNASKNIRAAGISVLKACGELGTSLLNDTRITGITAG